jgi:hypothetical protein
MYATSLSVVSFDSSTSTKIDNTALPQIYWMYESIKLLSSGRNVLSALE